MRIENIRQERVAKRLRVAARVVWEDCEKPADEIYFETDEAFESALVTGPEPFLAAALTPALWAGEKRIKVEGETCPELLDNLRVATSLFKHWYRFDSRLVAVEAKPRARAEEGLASRSASLFFSGGLDSLSALRTNRLQFPSSHPGSVKDGIIVFGLEVEKEEPFRFVLESLSDLARESEVNLIPLSTNIRSLNPDWIFWWNGYMGPALCAIALALGRRCSSALIASDYDVPNLRPHGSHPLIEPNFSSHAVKMRYDGITLSRLEKARLVTQWAPSLRYLRVCNKPQLYERGRLNCGECEKCIRTMLEFLACGVLDKTTAFVHRELTPEIILTKAYLSPANEQYYEELIKPLAQIGRNDLSEAIVTFLAQFRREIGWRGRLRRFDRERLNGGLLSLKRAIRPSEVEKPAGAK